MAEMDNANPTVLAASDLPTRKPLQKRTNSSQLGIFASIPRVSPVRDPFTVAPGQLYESDTSDSEEDFELDAEGDKSVEEIDPQEIYDLIAPISDPEHPLSLGELAVVNLPHIYITPGNPISTVLVEITPTITHCSLATVIGLGVRVRLEQALPPRYRVDVRIREGTHSTGDQVNKQLADKERVAAACENESLMSLLRKMLEGCK